MPSYLSYRRQLAHSLDTGEFREEDHPRDEDGKFTDGDNKGIKSRQSNPLRVIVKPVADIKAYRKATLQWYKDNLQGKTVNHPELGEILFSLRGGKHVLQMSAENKLALVRYLPELIQHGETDGWHSLTKARPDGWVAFAYIRSDAIINSVNHKVGVVIAKDKNGQIFYDIGLNKERGLNPSLASKSQADKTPEFGTESGPQFGVGGRNTFSSDSIDQENYIVNLFIEDAK